MIGKYDWFDVPIDVNRFVNLAGDFPTLRYHFERKVNSSIYAKHYSRTVDTLRGWLEKPVMPEAMDQPDPYLASAAINQPLWKSAVSMGFGTVERVYLKAIASLTEFESYSDLAGAVLTEARNVSTKWCKDLQGMFSARGLMVNTDACETQKSGSRR